MGLVFSTDVLIILVQRWREARRWQFRGRAAPVPEPTVVELPAQGSPVSLDISRGMWCLAVGFALLGVAQLASAAARGGVASWILRGAGVSALRTGAGFTSPKQVAGWQRSEVAEKLLSQPELEGMRSLAWVYQQGGVNAVVAIDYPFAGHHDLTFCYRNGGWNIEDVKARPGVGAFSVVRVGRMNESGYLSYASIDEEGQWSEPPKPGVTDRLVERFRKMGKTGQDATTYQIQVWAQTYTPLTEAQQGQLEQLFLTVRQDLAKQVLSQLRK